MSWPVAARGLGLGTIDHPEPEAAGGGASEARTPVGPLVPATFPTADPADWVAASAPGAASPALPAAKVNTATAARYFVMADPRIAASPVLRGRTGTTRQIWSMAYSLRRLCHKCW
jgi:hypothetical protein